METKEIIAHFIAKVTYRTTEKGGRNTPANSGYRPQIKFPFSEQMTSAMQNFVGKDIVFPGETIITEIHMSSPQLFKNQLESNMPFELREGARTIANGIVLKIVNDALRK